MERFYDNEKRLTKFAWVMGGVGQGAQMSRLASFPTMSFAAIAKTTYAATYTHIILSPYLCFFVKKKP